MRRRRLQPQGESFGLSLADVLTTALGCVLLLFLAAMLLIKRTLNDELTEHAATRVRLEAQAEGRRQAEEARRDERGQRTAIEQTLSAEQKAHAEAMQRIQELETRLAGTTSELERSRAAEAEASQRYRGLHDAARTAAQELDPRTASPVDVVMVVDGTRSMLPSLDATRHNLISTVQALRVVSPTARVGVVVFRDKREPARLRLESHSLTSDERALAKFLQGIEATSTEADDDLPEWLCGGISAAVDASWRPEAIKLMIVVSDAGAQEPKDECSQAAARFAKEGGRIYMLSNEPKGFRERGMERLRKHYKDEVLPLHARIAKEGRGLHVKGANADALLTEVLRAAFRSRTETPLDALKQAVEAGGAPAEPEPPVEP
ncbi:MAG: VWA domain-containing protein [Myxococcales bacterium]|nr:VWA domain-containing protein [Myxococcales bacterium]